MTITPEGLALIKQYEGFSPTPYRCPGGYWTIGYGHVLSEASPHMRLTEAEAEALLQQDVAQAMHAVMRLIHVPLAPQQQAALASFTFNVGAGALQRSTLRRVLNRGAYDAIPAQLQRWVYAGGRKLPGLLRRRHAEGLMFIGNPTYTDNEW